MWKSSMHCHQRRAMIITVATRRSSLPRNTSHNKWFRAVDLRYIKWEARACTIRARPRSRTLAKDSSIAIRRTHRCRRLWLRIKKGLLRHRVVLRHQEEKVHILLKLGPIMNSKNLFKNHRRTKNQLIIRTLKQKPVTMSLMQSLSQEDLGRKRGEEMVKKVASDQRLPLVSTNAELIEMMTIKMSY